MARWTAAPTRRNRRFHDRDAPRHDAPKDNGAGDPPTDDVEREAEDRLHHVIMATDDTGSVKFSRVLLRAEENLWTSFEQAREFAQRGDVGDVREDAVARFLRQRLPSRFGVASGEVVDTAGTQSSQTDILIYDTSLTAPLFHVSHDTVLLPAEALLAAIEIKSTLTKSEVVKCVKGVRTLHALRPWDAPFAVVAGPQGARTADDLPRILTSIFAYKSDLRSDGWAEAELKRVRTACSDALLPVPCLDRVIVLDRGLLNPSYGRALLTEEKGTLGNWFFNLINFLSREAPRRRPFPWKDYHNTVGQHWVTAAAPVFDAPSAVRATSSKRLKARKKRIAGTK